MATFGENLKRIRKSRGLTQEEFSDVLGVSRTALAKWEKGVNSPTLSFFREFPRILGCSFEELLGGEPQEPSRDVIKVTVEVNGKEVMRWQNTDTE